MFISGGNPISSIRSFFRDSPPSVQDMSREEFRSALERSERRHGHREPIDQSSDTSSSHREPPPELVVEIDTDVRQMWNRRFSSRTRKNLKNMNVIPANPEIDRQTFVGQTPSGDTQSSRQYRGHWLLVNFWASWCVPCREEMPSLDQLNQKFPVKLAVVAINVGEDRDTIRSFREDVSFDFPVWLDTDQSLTESFGTRRLPETWIVDPKGRYVGVLQGPREWTKNESLNLFRSLTT